MFWISNKLWVFAMNKGTVDIQWNDTSIAPCVIHTYIIMDDNVTWYAFIFAICTLEISNFFSSVSLFCYVLFSFVFRFVPSMFALALMKSERLSRWLPKRKGKKKRKPKQIDINCRIWNSSAIYVENKEIDTKSMCFAFGSFVHFQFWSLNCTGSILNCVWHIL